MAKFSIIDQNIVIISTLGRKYACPALINQFQMIKQKAYLLHGNLDQLSNLNMGFAATVLLLLTDIHSD